MEDTALTLSMLDSLLDAQRLLSLPKCEVWLSQHVPRGEAYKIPLDNPTLKFLVSFTPGVEHIYLMNEDDFTDDIMETLRGANIPAFDVHGRRLP